MKKIFFYLINTLCKKKHCISYFVVRICCSATLRSIKKSRRFIFHSLIHYGVLRLRSILRKIPAKLYSTRIPLSRVLLSQKRPQHSPGAFRPRQKVHAAPTTGCWCFSSLFLPFVKPTPLSEPALRFRKRRTPGMFPAFFLHAAIIACSTACAPAVIPGRRSP